MPETPFIITVDTEGDNLWERPREITTRNAGYLPRFQALCERFGFKPVYLTNYEMAKSAAFVDFGRDVIARGKGEIGMHLHAWNSPPIESLTGDDLRFQPYLIEYPPRVIREKIRTLTRLLEERFDRPMVSHRAGRWALDRRYAAALAAEGYRVDCSVTPGVNWSSNPGAPRGGGGTDYTLFPSRPYFFSPDDIAVPGRGPLLQVPVTVRPSGLYRRLPWMHRLPLVRRVANSAAPALAWLAPVQPSRSASLARDLKTMLSVARASRADGVAHMEFMVHSSELMPGGSPTIRSAAELELLYDRLAQLFQELSSWCRGMTLQEFHARLQAARGLPGGKRDRPPSAVFNGAPGSAIGQT